MKEYLLIPKSHIEENKISVNHLKNDVEVNPKLFSNKSTNDLQVNIQQPIDPKFSPFTREILKNNLKNELLADNVQSPEFILGLYEKINKLSSLANNEKEITTFDTFANTIPLAQRQNAQNLINILVKSNRFDIDKYGIITEKETLESIRLEDLLRSILIKNAKVSHIKDFIRKTMDVIPNDMINNSKFKLLKSRGGSLNNTNQWIIFKRKS